MTTEIYPPRRNTSSLAFRLILALCAGSFGIVMILIARGATKPIGHVAFGVFCLIITAACFVKGRAQRVMGSVIAFVVLVVAAMYLMSQLSSGPVFSSALSKPSVFNALLALVGFGLPALAYLRRARFGFGAEPEQETIETVEINDDGIARKAGSLSESIRWDEVEEIRIITTDEGPYAEDVFFVMVGAEDRGCMIPNDAAVYFKLVERLRSRFHGLDDEAIIKAMGSTTRANFLIWKRSPQGATG